MIDNKSILENWAQGNCPVGPAVIRLNSGQGGGTSRIGPTGPTGPTGAGGGGAAFNVEITNTSASTLVATVAGGTAPYTYLWTVRSNNSGAPSPIDSVITAGQGTDTIELQIDGTRRSGLLEVLVTDANGSMDKAYWWSNITAVG